MPNHAINADGLGQRAYGASRNPAGYGERSLRKMNLPDITVLEAHQPDGTPIEGLIFSLTVRKQKGVKAKRGQVFA